MTREKIIRMLLVDDVEAVRQRCGRSSRLIHVSPLRAKPATEEMLSHGSNDAVLGGGDEHSDAAPERHRDDAAHCTVCSCVSEVGLSVQATEDVEEMMADGATSVLTKDHANARRHEEITKAVDYGLAMLS